MILSSCSAHGEGGWQFVDPPLVDWIVVVEGTGFLTEKMTICD